MKKLLYLALSLLASVALGQTLEAQRAALRTNVLGLAVGNINLEASHMVGKRWSAHLSLQAKPFSYPMPAPLGLLRYAEGLDKGSNRLDQFGTIKHTENYTVQPSLRYWTRGVYNRGWFFGLHGVSSLFKYGGDRFDSNYREGWAAGAGLSAGYSFELAKRFNIEAEIGVAALYRNYDLISGRTDNVISTGHTDIIPSVSRLGVSLVYTL